MLTLQEAIDRFLSGYAPSTARTYRAVLNAFAEYIDPDLPLADVTPTDIARYAQHLRARNQKYQSHGRRPAERGPLSPWTVYKCFKTIKRLFNWSVKRGLLDVSPARDLVNPKPVNMIKDRSASDDEITALLDASRDHVRDYAIIVFLAESGGRREDAANLRLSDLDLGEQQAHVWAKGGVRVRRYFGEETAHAMLAWLQVRPHSDSDHVFVSSIGEPLTSDAIYQIFRRRSRDAGLPRTLNPHSLRHAVGTALHEEGYDILDIKEYLGHRSTNTTQVYVRVSPERMREAGRVVATRRKRKTTHRETFSCCGGLYLYRGHVLGRDQ